MGQSEPPQAPLPEGRIAALLSAVRGLTISNVLVIALLAIVAVPVYAAWRILNDEGLLDRFLSHYRELSSQQTTCTVREARERGGKMNWAVSSGFAYQGSDRWIVSVLLTHEPAPGEITSYCETINLVIEFMRDPEAESPPFPGTHEPVVRTYEKGRSDAP